MLQPEIDYGSTTLKALVVAEPGAKAGAALAAIERAQCGAVLVDFAEAARDVTCYDGVHLIVVEAAGAPDALLDLVLARVDTLARERSLGIVAALLPEQIDLGAAQLLGPRTQLLCHPTEGEWLSAVSIAAWRAGAMVEDASREPEPDQLQRVTAEVARLVDTLARLTRGEEAERRGGVRDTATGYRAEGAEPGDPSAPELRAVIRARRMRAQFFEGELFADPAWDMLLDLFASALENRRVSVSSLCIAAAVPPTTALRWIGTLHEAGLFERQADPADRRRAYIALSAKALDGMRNYVGAVRRHGLQLV
ncbi:winged helix DNA-binding protein [Sphingomonas hengshuiensis]|uniref:winged helix DNA-binding protein n=1 Tax=Sphingomonas hengshuiensis TaxID=1609977 RepID=UPI0005CB6227|nr:winged helix DNA-binding protein [Sphingomonas hengshuiensis]